MLSTLITTFISGEAMASVGRLRRAAVTYALAGILILCGAGFLLGATFVAVANEFGTIEAALGFGAGFILIALVLILIHRVSAKVEAKKIEKRRQSEMTAVVSAAAVAMLPTLLAGGKGRSAALLAPALAGLGWAIWRENTRRSRIRLRDDD